LFRKITQTFIFFKIYHLVSVELTKKLSFRFSHLKR